MACKVIPESCRNENAEHPPHEKLCTVEQQRSSLLRQTYLDGISFQNSSIELKIIRQLTDFGQGFERTGIFQNLHIIAVISSDCGPSVSTPYVQIAA